jgi:hypothetical protein
MNSYHLKYPLYRRVMVDMGLPKKYRFLIPCEDSSLSNVYEEPLLRLRVVSLLKILADNDWPNPKSFKSYDSKRRVLS